MSFNEGRIVYNEFDINFDKKFSNQEECVLEDLLQVSYTNGYLLDLGWYPEFDVNGTFMLDKLLKIEIGIIQFISENVGKKMI